MAAKEQTHAATPFRALVVVAEAIGTGNGLPATIQLYRDWIAAQAAGAKDLYCAWFNLGAELGHAGAPADAMHAYRRALAINPNFAPAAVNLGLLLESAGHPQSALKTWEEDRFGVGGVPHNAARCPA